jgi:transcriptional regulator with XRE-family HTH domain
MQNTPSVVTGANVRAEMARRGISQAQMAQAVGLSQAGVSKRLRGEVAFNIDELFQVAAVLGLPLSTLTADVANEATA